jgi:hypothetical protein
MQGLARCKEKHIKAGLGEIRTNNRSCSVSCVSGKRLGARRIPLHHHRKRNQVLRNREGERERERGEEKRERCLRPII